jgi:hypothetical protein
MDQPGPEQEELNQCDSFLASTTPIEATRWWSLYTEKLRTRIGAIPAAQRTHDEAAAYEATKLKLGAVRVL